MRPVSSPFSCFEVQVRSQVARAAHTHNIHEFFVCLDGHGTQYAGRAAVPQHRADVFCFPAGLPHYCSGRPEAPTKGYVIMVPDAMFPPETYGDRETYATLQRLVQLARGGTNPLPMARITAQQVLSLTGRMVQEFSGRKPGYQAACRLLLQDVFLHLMRDPAVAPEHRAKRRLTRHDDRLAPVFQGIDERFMEPLTVAEMARLACMSRSHFHAVFRRVAGCTLIDYVTRIRVQAARRLLRESNTRVIQIAMDCGFQTVSRFYDAFKSITGKTPRGVRREN